MNELMAILNDLRVDVDFENETKLIDDGILESFDIIALIGEINDSFDVNIGIEHLTAENFNSAKSIYSLITTLQEG
jgi:acyl carrier protein